MKNVHYALLAGLLALVAAPAFSQATPDQVAQDKQQLYQYKKDVNFYQRMVDKSVKQGDVRGAEQWEQRREQAKRVYNAQKRRVKQEQPLQVNTRPPEDPRVQALKKQRNDYQKNENEAVKRGDLAGAQQWKASKEQIQRELKAINRNAHYSQQ